MRTSIIFLQRKLFKWCRYFGQLKCPLDNLEAIAFAWHKFPGHRKVECYILKGRSLSKIKKEMIESPKLEDGPDVHSNKTLMQIKCLPLQVSSCGKSHFPLKIAKSSMACSSFFNAKMLCMIVSNRIQFINYWCGCITKLRFWPSYLKFKAREGLMILWFGTKWQRFSFRYSAVLTEQCTHKNQFWSIRKKEKT